MTRENREQYIINSKDWGNSPCKLNFSCVMGQKSQLREIMKSLCFGFVYRSLLESRKLKKSFVLKRLWKLETINLPIYRLCYYREECKITTSPEQVLYMRFN